jgi:hypothetical protein
MELDVSLWMRAGKRGAFFAPGLGDVVENTYIKNVSFSVSRDVDENKRDTSPLWRSH